MVERIVTIRNRAGMHARPAALLVKTASSFASQISIEKDSERVNCKSIMGVITLGATFNTPLKIIADGPDEAEAVDAIQKLFDSRFEEE
jgi:phosphocarrier protein HPr